MAFTDFDDQPNRVNFRTREKRFCHFQWHTPNDQLRKVRAYQKPTLG